MCRAIGSVSESEVPSRKRRPAPKSASQGEFTVWNEKNVRTPENERRRGQTKESEV
jgi:hypothetical protein